MTPNEYQTLASRTLIEKPDFQITDLQLMIVWNAVGLGGEAGEVLEVIKKGIFHQHGLDLEKLEKELGDVLWYIAAICTKTGLQLEQVMKENINKLVARFPDGYTPERTKYREGEAE